MPYGAFAIFFSRLRNGFWAQYGIRTEIQTFEFFSNMF